MDKNTPPPPQKKKTKTKKQKNLGLPTIPCRKTSLGVFNLQKYARIRGPHYSQKYLLKSNHQKKILSTFAFPNKNRRIEDFKPQKILRSFPHLKSAVPPPPPPTPRARPLGGKERMRLDREVGVMVPTDIEQKHMASSWFMTGAP